MDQSNSLSKKANKATIWGWFLGLLTSTVLFGAVYRVGLAANGLYYAQLQSSLASQFQSDSETAQQADLSAFPTVVQKQWLTLFEIHKLTKRGEMERAKRWLQEPVLGRLNGTANLNERFAILFKERARLDELERYRFLDGQSLKDVVVATQGTQADETAATTEEVDPTKLERERVLKEYGEAQQSFKVAYDQVLSLTRTMSAELLRMRVNTRTSVTYALLSSYAARAGIALPKLEMELSSKPR